MSFATLIRQAGELVTQVMLKEIGLDSSNKVLESSALWSDSKLVSRVKFLFEGGILIGEEAAIAGLKIMSNWYDS